MQKRRPMQKLTMLENTLYQLIVSLGRMHRLKAKEYGRPIDSLAEIGIIRLDGDFYVPAEAAPAPHVELPRLGVSVKLPPALIERVDAQPGKDRTAKIEMLLEAGLKAIEGKGSAPLAAGRSTERPTARSGTHAVGEALPRRRRSSG